MDYYYLDEGGKTVGPVPDNVLQALHGTGLVKGATLVAAVGSDEWVSFDSQFAPATKKLPPVPKAATPRVPSTPAARQGSGAMGIKLIFVGLIAILGAGGLVAWVVLVSGKSQSENQPVAASAKNDIFGETVVPTEKASEPVAVVVTPPASSAADTEKMKASSSEVSSLDKAGATMPTTPSDPLAEWYEFGFRQGQEASKVFKAFGIVPSADRAHVAQLVKNMALDAKDIDSKSADVCFAGYRDGIAGNAPVQAVGDQERSILPSKLRGYHIFKGDLIETETGNEAFDHAVASTVLIRVQRAGFKAHGSGFFISPGVVATNRHVVTDAQKFEVQIANGKLLPAKLIAKSEVEELDIALLSVNFTDHPCMRLGDSRKVKLGAEIRVLGFPATDKLSVTMTKGIVSGLDRSVFGSPCFQVDASTNGGNSGGPHINLQGEVVAIHTYGFKERQGFNFGIQMNPLLPFIREHCSGPLDIDE